MSIAGAGKGKKTDGYLIAVDCGLGNTLFGRTLGVEVKNTEKNLEGAMRCQTQSGLDEKQIIFHVIPSLEQHHVLACRVDEVRHALPVSMVLL